MDEKEILLIESTLENYLPNFHVKIGETIREIREKRGYNQEQLAKIMEVNRSTISKIENGKFNISIDYSLNFPGF